jgi:hypothetical protein
MTTIAVLLLAGHAAFAATVDTSFSTSSVTSPTTIYTGEKQRDPFVPFSAGGGTIVSKPYNADDFNIHSLSLRGIMKDTAADYALFTDRNSGATFILRRGKLYDPKNKVVPGIAGKLKVKDKWAQLETSDHDVQIFRLGEEEKE